MTAGAGQPWRGFVMALLVGMAFAANTSLAAVAYTGGATPLAVLLARTTTAFVVLFLLLTVRRMQRTLPARQGRAAVLIGFVFAAYAFCVLAAIQYLPVGVVVATFYLFPILIALIEWWSGRQPFNVRAAAALLIAFVGILCALNVFGATLHRFGVSLSLAGALCVSVVIILSGRIRNGGDSRPVTLYMLGTALVVFATVVLLRGGAALPQTDYAWFGFVAGPVFYTFAIITLFVVNADIGPVKTSMFMNIEPVTSVVLGYILLDQRLAPIQLIGIVIVIGAVLLVESAKRDVARPPAFRR